MKLGILECEHGVKVPGTTRLIEARETVDDIGHDEHSKETIILDPAPTDDPNDPLNWPLGQRDLMLVILCLAAFFLVSAGSILGSAFVALSTTFERSFADIANLTAYWQLAIAIAGAIVVPFARIWGKRHQYLLGALLVFVGCIWSGQSTSFTGFLWSRITQGVGGACFEALLGTSMGDLYHVHQRGVRLSIVTIMGFAAGFMSPVLSGLVVDQLGWQWIFHILAILSGLMLLLIFLFVPETSYDRTRSTTTPQEATAIGPSEADKTIQGLSFGNNGMSLSGTRQRVSLARRLLPIQRRISKQNIFMLLLRPFILILHPAVLWFILFSGTAISWVIFTVVVMGITFPGPPLNFSPFQIGLMNLSACVGSLIGAFLCALISDRSATWLAKRNNGIYEPEFRLVLAIPQLILGFIGLYGFGVAAADPAKYGWFWPAFFYAIQIVAMVMATMVGSVYIVDGYDEIVVEAFIIFMILKNMVGYGLATAAVGWIEQTGILRIFTIVALVQVGIGLTTIPLYVFGKRIRSRFSKIGIFKSNEL